LSKTLKKRAEATALYHSKHITDTLQGLIEQYELLAQEERRTEDKDLKVRIENERYNLRDLLEDQMNRLNEIMNNISE
jgi:hypothetical protein